MLHCAKKTRADTLVTRIFSLCCTDLKCISEEQFNNSWFTETMSDTLTSIASCPVTPLPSKNDVAVDIVFEIISFNCRTVSTVTHGNRSDESKFDRMSSSNRDGFS